MKDRARALPPLLLEDYKKFFQGLLPLVSRRKSPELMMGVLEYLINKYKEERNVGKTDIRVSIPEISKEFEISWQTAYDILEGLVELNIIKRVGEKIRRIYNRKYAFPNQTIENSVFGPISKISQCLTQWTHVATSQIEKIKSSVKVAYPPIIQLNKREFYAEASYIHLTSNHTEIFSNTPGIILITEYNDPENPGRKVYFETLERRLKEGLRTKYLFNYDATLNKLKFYRKYPNNVEKSLQLYDRFFSLNNLEIRYIQNTTFPGIVIGPEAVIIGVKDTTATDLEHTIRGLLIHEEYLIKFFREEFMKLWNNSKKVSKDTIKKMLENIN